MKSLGLNEPCNLCESIPTGTFFVNRDQAIKLESAPTPGRDDLIAAIVFKTNETTDFRRYLEAEHVQVNKGDPSNPRTSKVLSLNDPEGHLLIFAENLPTEPSQIVSGSTSLTPPGNLHIIHAGFIVHDRAATEHFYKDILGFRPYWHGGMKEDQTDWVSMQVPDGTDWLEFMVNVSPDADQRVRGIMNHIAIGVTDIHETEKRLREAGAPVNEPPKIGRDGKWQLNLYDPDQTRVEFMEFTPVQKPCCSEFTGPHPHP